MLNVTIYLTKSTFFFVLKHLRSFGIYYLNFFFQPIFRVFKHNHFLELLWTLFPTLVILLLLSPSLGVLCYLESLFTLNEPFITVKVVGNQWFWTYGFVTDFINFKVVESYMMLESELNYSNLRLFEVDHFLVLPINSPLRFLITSIDVLHSWAVPSLGIKMDACPGRLNQFLSLIIRPGDFYGQCSEICGINHGFMPINIVGFFK